MLMPVIPGYENARMPVASRVVVLAFILVLARCIGQDAHKENLPRMVGALLLTGYPPDDLTLTTSHTTLKVQDEGGDWYVTPSMSADGQLIASAHNGRNNAAPTPRPVLTVAVYSMIDKGWRDYSNVEILGGRVAISEDGSKLACVTLNSDLSPSRLQLLDLKTGAVSRGPDFPTNAGDITWSPDGRRLAFTREIERSKDGKSIPPLQALFVLDIETGTVSKIADGMSPSWSPSGEWIAFYDYEPGRDDVKRGWYADNANRVSVIHPDGTGHRILVTFHRDDSLNVPPVWSPDSASLLINKSHDYDRGAMDILQFYFATLKLQKQFRNVPAVYGWASAR